MPAFDNLRESLQNFVNQVRARFGSATSGNRQNNGELKLEEALAMIRKLKWPALFLCGLLAGDLLVQSGVSFLPATKGSGDVRNIAPKEIPYLRPKGSYEGLISRNMFCPGCPVPDMKMRAIERPKDCNKATPASGGIKLIGTIVLSNPLFSVATLSTGGGESIAVKVGDQVPRSGKVFEIRRTRVCFETNDGFLNSIDLPEEDNFKFGQPLAQNMAPSSFEGISRKSENEIEIKRSFLVEKIQDPNLLFQAHAVPYMEGGAIKGFKVLSVVPGSVYEALDIQPDDIIRGVNGAPLTSISQAQELYNSVNSASDISLEIQRGGQTLSRNFKVK